MAGPWLPSLPTAPRVATLRGPKQRDQHIAWTVVQVQDGLTFVTLFQKILVGDHPWLQVDEQLSCSTLDKFFVGHSKESMSVVDEKFVMNDVCSMFGSLINLVQLQLTVPDVP